MVLVVDGNPDVRSIAVDILEHLGYLVLQAGNGSEAIQVVTSHPGKIDILLTDLIMPGMGGRELSEKIHELRPQVRILFMSGYSEDEELQRQVREDGVAFIQKPFTHTELREKIRGL
jgi:two-component system, cell cycle sensor histidine kinase and response regulator CckA